MALKSWPTDEGVQLSLLAEIRSNAGSKCSFSWQSNRDGKTHSCSLPSGHLNKIHVSDPGCICGSSECEAKYCKSSLQR
jgi:hypothetical protein